MAHWSARDVDSWAKYQQANTPNDEESLEEIE